MAEIRSKISALTAVSLAVLFLMLVAVVASANAWAQQTSNAAQSKSGRGESSRIGTSAGASQGSRGATKESASSGSRGGTRLMISGKSIHLSCTRSLRDLARNRLECFGNVYIRRPSELLTADYVQLDLTTDQMHAEGNVVYFTPDSVIYGQKMDFNFFTETGTIEDGRVESDKYQLVGEKIERLSVNHFIAHDGEYTTCRDCPASWKLAGHKVDLTVDGYAYLNQVYVKLNDAPTLYLPYAVIPVKTRRQSGLLFPRTGYTQNGFTFVQPYFWAISRSTDATLGLGFYSLRGFKAEGQFRYVLSPRSYGQLDAFYLRDRQFIKAPYYNRWALNYGHNLELPFKLEQKLYYLDASDRDYPRNIGDIPGRGEPAFVSTASLSRSERDLNISVSAKRIHNLLTPAVTGFDPNTVQLAPSVSIASTDHAISDGVPIYWGVSANYSRFTRAGPAFDPIYPADYTPPSSMFFIPGQTPLRRSQRLMLVPELYSVAHFFDFFDLTPSVRYRTYSYTFDTDEAGPTARGYLLAQAELSTGIERVYGTRVKHTIRPAFTYSNIPIVQQNAGHPFIQQLKTAGNEFDELDIVPISSDTQLYFVPLGNSLSYQLGNKFIYKDDDGSYKKSVDVVSGQSINFYEYKKETKQQPFSRFYTLANVNTNRVSGRLEYYYYPYSHAQTYSLSASYVIARYTRRLLIFDRSVNLNYSANQVTTSAASVGGGVNWSINDYFAFNAAIDYRMPTVQGNQEIPGVIQSISGGVTYQSPSQCYKLQLLASRTVDNPKVSFAFSIPINLTGDGFANLQEGGGVVGPQQSSPGTVR